MLRQQGKCVEAATTYLAGLSVAEKNELLFRQGVNFNELPIWQKRGIGVLWETYDRAGTNLLTGEAVVAPRQINGLEITDLFMVISSSNSRVANGVSKRNQQCGNGNWGLMLNRKGQGLD